MIPSYSEYIRRYVHRQGRHSPPSPGEHHFVATYLLPKLYEINGQVPDYVNPDGTKSIVGDVVYFKDERHHFGIEVKLGTIRLTRREFNDWIVNEDKDQWPDLFLGVGKKGLVLSSWPEFREVYIAAVCKKKPGWVAREIADGYGPMKAVDELAASIEPAHWFALVTDAADDGERRFTATLRAYLEQPLSIR